MKGGDPLTTHSLISPQSQRSLAEPFLLTFYIYFTKFFLKNQVNDLERSAAILYSGRQVQRESVRSTKTLHKKEWHRLLGSNQYQSGQSRLCYHYTKAV